MKYMGSKRAMLLNGLGDLLEREIGGASRFVDLFTGSGAVAIHVAQKYNIPVIASDLQAYSVILANSIIRRQKAIACKKLWNKWHAAARAEFKKTRQIPVTRAKLTKRDVTIARSWSDKQTQLPITAAYGGHYFSPRQAVWIDAYRRTLPRATAQRELALAALIQAASHCAASPGHTAQPFQPTATAKKFLAECWQRKLGPKIRQSLERLASLHSLQAGRAYRVDAHSLAKTMSKHDVVFIDPPYSGVHYSRFYHVLESIALGRSGSVSGKGRYPAEHKRPRSSFSVLSEASVALDELLATLARRGSKVIMTFPNHACSNGLSGQSVKQIASKHFNVRTKTVASKFSTLGGTSDNSRANEAGRSARQDRKELVLTLSLPR